MKEVVINSCYGGFGLSPKAIKRYLELKGKECFVYLNNVKLETDEKIEKNKNRIFLEYYTKDFGEIVAYNENIKEFRFSIYDLDREDKDLIRVIKELGAKADGTSSKLKIIEIPEDIEYTIEEYDGIESIEEVHRSWY